MATTTLDQVLAHIQQAHPIPGGNSRPVSYKHAAVLIPLYEANPGGEVRVLLTQRSKNLRSHPGETCFPGGKRDDEDIDDISTAVREIREELGIQADEIRVVAVLPPVLSKHLYSVTPVVARLVNPIHEIAVEPNSEEVDHVFSAPLGMFLSHTWPDARYSFRDGTWDDIKYRMHVWEYRWTGDTLPSRDANNEVLTFVIWGLTAALCVDVAILGYQRSPSFCCLPDESYSMLHDVEYVDGKYTEYWFRTTERLVHPTHVTIGTMRSLILFALLFALFWGYNDAKITEANVVKEDRLLVPLDEPYGFGPGGKINITLSGFELRPLYDPKQKSVTNPDLRRMGILITTPYGGLLLEEEVESKGTCPLDSQEQITLVRFNEIDLAGKSLERDFVLDDMLEDYEGGEFILYFANCEANTAVDFDIVLSLYNQKGDKEDYLPVGMDALPFLYFMAFLAFSGLLAWWTLTVLKAKQGAHMIHYLMGALVLLRALTVLSQSGMYHMIAWYGHPEGWNIAYYFFTAMRSVLFFSVVILIAAGWSYMKPFLSEREKQILLLVVPLQVFANVAIVVMDETTPASKNWFSWRDIWHVVDILCCCAILFPIVWSIRHMRETAEHDDKAARVLSKLVLFRQFYVMVVSYIYFTRIIVYLLDATLPYQYIWLSALANELATIAFFVACGLQFRPVEGGMNPYFSLDTDEEMELARNF